MSEEILRALTQLFAIISKQDDGVTENERNFVRYFFDSQLPPDRVAEYMKQYDEESEWNKKDQEEEEEQEEVDPETGKPKKKKRRTKMMESVRTLSICKKINKTLTQKQKVIVLIRLLELVATDRNFTKQRQEIIQTVSEVFNIKNEEYRLIECFVIELDVEKMDYSDLLVVDEREEVGYQHAHHIRMDNFDGPVIFMRVASEEMYFVRYQGQDKIILNGFDVGPNRVQVFSNGSIIKSVKAGDPLYYSDVVTHFASKHDFEPITFNIKDLEFQFPNGTVGLRGVDLAEEAGRLVAIMGASGAGKTTLLNVMAGLNTPTKGEVTVNGVNLHENKSDLQGMVGYIAQDDILIEDLTVFQNLYFNAKLCFKGLSEEEIRTRVFDTLKSLGLDHIHNLKVGSVLNKKISGGQRKRLNIALELIREPQILFVDEPTSGLSSRDSENVIDLLKELALKGKLIFVVIHQPSSDIFKMFDRLYLLDTGGYPIFYGNPVQSVIYFKTVTNQIDKDVGQCPECGNVNPEQIFNVVEARVVDEYGQFTNERKRSPAQWGELFRDNFEVEHIEEVRQTQPHKLEIPGKLTQYIVYTLRDVLAKLSNSQYMAINLLEAPALAFLMAFIIRYQNEPDTNDYLYRYNDNIPAFILISVIIAIFMGLTVSAEEIIKDRKIQKRESFLNLSRTSYLFSKLTILFVLSAIQTLTFVIIGEVLLGINGMTLNYWAVLFTVSCFANVLGLNISSAFDTAVTIYILIPLLLIPQMILSGGIFNFDKLNSVLGGRGKVPMVADLMASRWGFEALTVVQFKDNAYQEMIFPYAKLESQANYKEVYLIPELEARLVSAEKNLKSGKDSLRREAADDLAVVRNQLAHIQKELPQQHNKAKKAYLALEKLNYNELLKVGNYNPAAGEKIREGLETLKTYYNEIFLKANQIKDRKLAEYARREDSDYTLTELKNHYFNESLSDLVRNVGARDRFLEYENRLIQQIDPIYNDPPKNPGPFNYRTHFYSPQKPFLGQNHDTFWFNIGVVWLMTVILYFTLYFEYLRKLIIWFANLSLPSFRVPKMGLKLKVKKGDRAKPKNAEDGKNRKVPKPEEKALTH